MRPQLLALVILIQNSLVIHQLQAQQPMRARNYVPRLVHPSYSQAEIREARVKAGEPRYKIAIIDTGYDPTRATALLKLCKKGHYDYGTKTANLAYNRPHGTFMASIIAEKLKDVDYCAIVYQAATGDGPMPVAPDDVVDALNNSIAEKVDAVNLSLVAKDIAYPPERAAIQVAADLGLPVFIAAGNNKANLDVKCNYYPACYKIKGAFIVGAQDPLDRKHPASYSNYGKVVDVWGPGEYVDYQGYTQTGTSVATARALSEYILFLEHKRLKP